MMNCKPVLEVLDFLRLLYLLMVETLNSFP